MRSLIQRSVLLALGLVLMAWPASARAVMPMRFPNTMMPFLHPFMGMAPGMQMGGGAFGAFPLSGSYPSSPFLYSGRGYMNMGGAYGSSSSRYGTSSMSYPYGNMGASTYNFSNP